MVLNKLPIFLKDIDCKLLIKYDGERSSNKYTIRLLYNNLNKMSLGKNTDLPSTAITKIAEKVTKFPVKEGSELFSTISDDFIEKSIQSYGKQCIVSTKIEEKEGQLYYSVYIQIGKWSTHASSLILHDALKQVFLDCEAK